MSRVGMKEADRGGWRGGEKLIIYPLALVD